jgi:hypothetical protein
MTRPGIHLNLADFRPLAMACRVQYFVYLRQSSAFTSEVLRCAGRHPEGLPQRG